ncbi:MAG: Na(+)/H(+) antiporter subunit C [Actinomycetota bacterium]
MTFDVTPAITLVILAAVLVAVGISLMLERSLTRIVIGLVIASNGVNVLFLVAGGRAGGPPLNDGGSVADMADPLPQAMVLTAIVITLGMTAFLLAMAYRSWQLNGHDEVQDDLEDRRVVRRAARDLVSRRVRDDSGATLAEDARVTRDETATDLGAES